MWSRITNFAMMRYMKHIGGDTNNPIHTLTVLLSFLQHWAERSGISFQHSLEESYKFKALKDEERDRAK